MSCLGHFVRPNPWSWFHQILATCRTLRVGWAKEINRYNLVSAFSFELGSIFVKLVHFLSPCYLWSLNPGHDFSMILATCIAKCWISHKSSVGLVFYMRKQISVLHFFWWCLKNAQETLTTLVHSFPLSHELFNFTPRSKVFSFQLSIWKLNFISTFRYSRNFIWSSNGISTCRQFWISSSCCCWATVDLDSYDSCAW